MVLYVTADDTKAQRPPTVASMEKRARKILRAKGVDPDGIADQGDIAADLDIPRRSVSWLRQQYRGPRGIRGKTLEPFPAPERFVGGGGGNPIWLPRWQPLAWHLAREATEHARRVEAGRRGMHSRWHGDAALAREQEGR
jgi:hypothetical protein